MVKIYYFISACLLLFSCNNSNNTQVSSFDDTTDTISSIKRDTIVDKDTITPIQAPKEETDEATKMILEFYDNRYDSIQLKVAKKKDRYIIDDIIF